MSPVWQPPWPLQLFRPLQSCLAAVLSEELAFVPSELLQPVVVIVPATKPAIAAEMINVRAVRVINVNFSAVLFALNELRMDRPFTNYCLEPPNGTLSHAPRFCKAESAYLTNDTVHSTADCDKCALIV